MATQITKMIVKNDYNTRYVVFTGEAGQIPIITYVIIDESPGYVGFTEIYPGGIYLSDSIPNIDNKLCDVTVDINGDSQECSFNQSNMRNQFPNIAMLGANVDGAPNLNIVTWLDSSAGELLPDRGGYYARWDTQFKMDVSQEDLGYSFGAESTTQEMDENYNNIFTSTLSPDPTPLGGTIYFMGRTITNDIWYVGQVNMYILYSYANGFSTPYLRHLQHNAPDWTNNPDFKKEDFEEAREINKDGRTNRTIGSSGYIMPSTKNERGYIQPDTLLEDVNNRYKL